MVVQSASFFYNFNITICNRLATMLISSVQAPLPLFQSKVADCLIRLGSLAGTTPDTLLLHFTDEPFSVIGEQLYLTHVRPICVDRHYLSPVIPTQDLIDDEKKQTKYFAKIDQLKDQRKIRPSLKVYQQTQEQTQIKQPIENKKAVKKGSKAYQNGAKERQQSFKNKAANQKFFSYFDLILNTHSRDLLQVEFGLNQKIMQIKFITFFYVRWFIDYNFPLQRVTYENIYQFISIFVKVVKIYEKFIGQKYGLTSTKENKYEKEMISPTLILDMKITLIYLVKKYEYGNIKILLNYPRLAYDNRYYKFFPRFDIKPYLSQIQLVNYIHSSIDSQTTSIKDSKVVIYNTMVGAGKTSVVLALNKLITDLNKNREESRRLKILYACELQSVSIQLARLAYQKLGSFALAKEKTVKYGKKQIRMTQIIKQSQNNANQTDLIIADWKCAYNLLDKHQISQEEQKAIAQYEKQTLKSVKVGKLYPQNTIIFVDEPTVDCYSTNSPQTNQLFQILADRPPKIIVLASATMPHIQQLQTCFDLVKKVRPNLIVEQVKSKEFQIGCEFYTFTEELFYPHTGVQSKQQLINVINKINQNPFLMRFYTGTTLFLLMKQLESRGIQIPDQLDLTGYSTTITYRDFPGVTNQILTILSKQSDQIIQEICQLKNLEIQKQIEKSQDKSQEKKYDQQLQSIFDSLPTVNKTTQNEKPKQINFSTIIKEDAYKFLGGCLIATSDPVEFALKHFKSWVKHIPKIKILRELIGKNKQDDQQQQEFIIGNGNPQSAKQRKKQKSIFPSYLKINTIFHYNRFKPIRHEVLSEENQKLCLSKIILSNSFSAIQHFLDGEVDEIILKLLLCGIGIYAENGLPKSYLQKVEELASLNRLAFIISDKSLCFGVNFPISNVILLDSLGTKLSWNQIFQLIGRAGRVGRSWAARCFVDEKTKQRLFNYIQSDDRKNGQEGLVFDQLGKYYISNPAFKLRTIKTEIRENSDLKNLVSHPNVIQINVNKDQIQDRNFRISNILLFVRNIVNKKQVFAVKTSVKSRKQSQKCLSYFEFPHSPIIYEDIPTVTNSQQIPIIDTEFYYKNENEFISKIIENARNRLLSIHFSPQQVKKIRPTNNFDISNLQQFHSNSTETVCLFMQYQSGESLNERSDKSQQTPYRFEQIYLNPIKYNPKLTQKITRKLNKFSNECKNLMPIMYSNPGQILGQHIKIIRQSIEYIKRKKNLQCYFQFMEVYSQKIKKDLNEITNQIQNKQSLLYLQQFKTIILIQKYIDLQNIGDPMFSIDKKIRNARQVASVMMAQNVSKQQGQQGEQEQLNGWEQECEYDFDEDTASEKQEQAQGQKEIGNDGQIQIRLEGQAFWNQGQDEGEDEQDNNIMNEQQKVVVEQQNIKTQIARQQRPQIEQNKAQAKREQAQQRPKTMQHKSKYKNEQKHENEDEYEEEDEDEYEYKQDEDEYNEDEQNGDNKYGDCEQDAEQEYDIQNAKYQ